jgi:molybdopterin-dependent oxidoreductase alpha subunit
MGIWEKVNENFSAALGREFSFAPPQKDGLDTLASIAAMADGRAKVFFAMGGNFAVAAPDTEAVFAALGNCRLTIQVLTKLNRTALVESDQTLILPCLGRSEIDEQRGYEQFVTTESTMLNVQMSKGIFEPASNYVRSEPWIVGQLAKATLGMRTSVDWDKMIANYDNIRNSIALVVDGCENYNERVRKPGGFYLKNPPRDRIFNTKTGKARFITSKLETIKIERDQLLLTTIRSHDQFNTTIYSHNDRNRGIHGSRRVMFMNVEDIAAKGLRPGQLVDVTSHFEDRERHIRSFAVVEYPIPKGCAAAYFPEANPLVPLGSFAKRSNTPASKAIVISVRSAI